MSWLARRLGWSRIKLIHLMMNDGFVKAGEPCPCCKRQGLYMKRDVERICFRCTYGWMWPSTREKFGWGAPSESLGLYSPWPDGKP